jgi:hypothetical protein
MRVVDVLAGLACVLSDIFWQHWNNGVVLGRGEGEARANRPLRAAVRNVPFIEVRCILRFVDVMECCGRRTLLDG